MTKEQRERTRYLAMRFRNVASVTLHDPVCNDVDPLLKKAMVDAARSMAEELEHQIEADAWEHPDE